MKSSSFLNTPLHIHTKKREPCPTYSFIRGTGKNLAYKNKQVTPTLTYEYHLTNTEACFKNRIIIPKRAFTAFLLWVGENFRFSDSQNKR
jgi:hypothetical protein